ncbi:MAG: DNA polymerase III subunit alpha, partial [Chloroflexi bacterium]|nr:DNA polymerase III subunit alpha [Chloroflexota bacterium]
MDFQDDRRDEVLHYVVRKYGRDHVAQIITFGTMGPKAALRDAGRALAIPFAEVDQVARLVPFRARTLDEALDTVPELRDIHESDETLGNLINNAKRLEGVVRHASTHAAGVLISKEPLTEYVPLQRPIKGNDDDLAMTQYSMEPIAKLGLLKMDFLGLSNLSILDKAIKVIAQHRGEQLDLHQVPLDDAKTFELLSSGQTTGVFQLESAGMRRHIKNLKPRSLMDISAMIALYRPGPMEHIDTYIQASHGKQAVEYPHPVLEEILEETHGVIVYQDQVLLIVQAIAGYSLGEADIVRKAMGKKIAAIMQEERQKFVTGALAQGFDQELADQIFALIEPFAGYAFNKAHSVSYALIAYWTAYFKANYPVEYMVALLNSHSGQQERIAIDVDECVRLKIQVLPPDINRSDVAFTVDTDPDGRPAIRFGLGSIKHVGSGALEALVSSRVKSGPFASLEDLCRNGDLGAINRRALESLVKVGALHEFGSRGSLLASMDRILAMAQRENQLRQSGQTTMFDLFGDSVDAPLGAVELVEAEEASPRERQAWERELLGKQVSDNPISTIAFDPKTEAITFLEELSEVAPNKRVTVVGQVYSVRNPRTKDGRTFAAVELELLGGRVEVVAWPELYEKDPGIWAEGTFLLVVGKVRTREDTVSVHAEEATLFTADGDIPQASESSTVEVETVPPDNPIVALKEPPHNLPDKLMKAPDGEIPAVTTVPTPASGAPTVSGNGAAAGSHTNGTNGKSGAETPQRRTFLISLTDSGDSSEDTFLVQSAIRLTLEFPGNDAVQLEITSNGKRVRLEMPLISIQLCQELEDRMAALIGQGHARAV